MFRSYLGNFLAQNKADHGWLVVVYPWSNVGLLDVKTGLDGELSRISILLVLHGEEEKENWQEQFWSPVYPCRDGNLKTDG